MPTIELIKAREVGVDFDLNFSKEVRKGISYYIVSATVNGIPKKFEMQMNCEGGGFRFIDPKIPKELRQYEVAIGDAIFE